MTITAEIYKNHISQLDSDEIIPPIASLPLSSHLVLSTFHHVFGTHVSRGFQWDLYNWVAPHVGAESCRALFELFELLAATSILAIVLGAHG